jgi:hypothetical protein
MTPAHLKARSVPWGSDCGFTSYSGMRYGFRFYASSALTLEVSGFDVSKERVRSELRGNVLRLPLLQPCGQRACCQSFYRVCREELQSRPTCSLTLSDELLLCRGSSPFLRLVNQIVMAMCNACRLTKPCLHDHALILADAIIHKRCTCICS